MNSSAPERSSISYFNAENQGNFMSRWKTIVTLVSKVGKGSSKDNKPYKILHDKYWLEAIDPLHRYGINLKLYYDVWFNSQSSEPFLYWLDFGDGKEIDLKECPRTQLQRQRIRYLGAKERQEYEVIIVNGKLVYKQKGVFVNTTKGAKWMFVLSNSRNLFVGQKEKGLFQHSSFLSGAATVASGRLVVYEGMLQAIWGYSGHYCPKEDNFEWLIRFLDEQQVDLSNVKMCAMDDDVLPVGVRNSDIKIASDSCSVRLINMGLSEISRARNC